MSAVSGTCRLHKSVWLVLRLLSRTANVPINLFALKTPLSAERLCGRTHLSLRTGFGK